MTKNKLAAKTSLREHLGVIGAQNNNKEVLQRKPTLDAVSVLKLPLPASMSKESSTEPAVINEDL